MQYQIPQFIDVEDKIVGPFSMRQFIYVCVSIGFSFFLYFTVQTLPWLIFSVFIVGTGFSAAFIRINGQSLPKIVRSAFLFYWKPQLYVWQPDRPNLPKNQATVGNDYFEEIISGLALKSAWQSVSTGKAPEKAKRSLAGPSERYEIFQRITGDRAAARRIDYR